MTDKKGAAMSIEIVVAIAIGIFLLIIIMIITKGSFLNFWKGANSCEPQRGTCFTSCGGDLVEESAFNAGCEQKYPGQNLVCCKGKLPGTGGTGTGATGEGANYQLITALVNKNNVKYGNAVELEIGKTARIDASIDYTKLNQLPNANKPNKYCSIFLKDYAAGKNYVMVRKNPKEKITDTETFDLIPVEETYNTENSLIVSCSDTDADKLWTRYFKPTELDAGRTYVATIIVYDDEVSDKMSKLTTPSFADNTEITDLIYNMNHWAAHFAFQLRVKPIVEITDISGIWVAYDDITVKAFAPYKLSKVDIAIVNQAEVNAVGSSDNIYARVYTACSNLAKNSPARYKSAVNKITAISSGKQGTNLGLFSLGKEAYQRARYVSQPQPITVNSETNTAKFRLDASSLSENFPTEASNLLSEMIITDQNKDKDVLNHYLCARVGVISSDKRVAAKQIIAFSINPLKLDVAPPMIENTDEYIQIVYPNYNLAQNTLQNLIQQGTLQQGQTLTTYYFNQYPTLVIKKCIDKSGCKNYDYYFAPTNIKININANDLQTGILATVLSAGLNYLYQELMTRNPLDTLCPLANSGQYRINTYPEIRFGRREEQGVFCIRAKDGAGNYWLTWKVVYEPYDVLEELAANATKAVTGGGGINPVIGG